MRHNINIIHTATEVLIVKILFIRLNHEDRNAKANAISPYFIKIKINK
jgi:hypothetical protein